jgi:ribonuclease P protein component
VYAVANNEAVARLGLIIGKRQARRAIERNRIKRALRESFRHQRQALIGVDVVVQLIESVGQSEIGKAAEALWPALTDELEKNHHARS